MQAEARARWGLGTILNKEAQYPAARAELEQALALFETLSDRLHTARAYTELGFAAWGMGEDKQGQASYRKALAEFEAAGELPGKAGVLYSLAFLEPDGPERDRLMRQALELAEQLGDQTLQGKILHSQGDRAFYRGDFAAAMEKLEQAAQCLEQARARPELARVLTSLGRVYRAHGHPDRSLEFYRRALKIQEEIGDQQGIIQSIDIIGTAHTEMGQHRQALEYYQRAVALAQKTGSAGIVNAKLMNLAGSYVELREYGRAAAILEKLARETPQPEARIYSYLSQAYTGLGRYRLALRMAEKAVDRSRESGDAEFLPYSLWKRAFAGQKLGNIAEALGDTREAIHAMEQLRARLVPTDFMKRGFAELPQELYGFAIALLHQSGRHPEALEIAEQARGRAFLDLLASREVQAKPADRTQVAALRELEGQLRSKGLDPAEARRGASYPLLLRGGDPELASLWSRWQSAEPELKSLVSATPLSAAEMAATAARLHSTLLSYWVGPEATFLWVVKPEGVIHAVRVDVKAERLHRLVRETRAGWQAPQGRGDADAKEQEEEVYARVRGEDVLFLNDTQKKAWRELYQLLIRPARQLLPKAAGSRLTIVPHGPLFQVSFAALLDERDRYLVETYAVHYAPAAAALQFTERKKQRASGQEPRYLLVADPSGMPSLPGGKSLPRLPGSRREVKAIAAMLPPGAVTVLAGEEALEENVRALAGDKTVVHFATHGILRDSEPFDSFLALGADAAGHADGRMTAKEIYELNLQADLVVLSACRTGLGKISGDGIIGLTRAFFYAGAPSVMATLWDVADEPTFLLVSEFYRSFHRLHDKSRALRAAQLRLLRALRAGEIKVSTAAGDLALPEHPVFWAGFVLVGEPE